MCPFCHDKDGHFYINIDSGQYMCHKPDCTANNGGSLYTLKKFLGDIINVAQIMPEEDKKLPTQEDMDKVLQAHVDLLKDKTALRYLAGRHFSDEAIDFFRLGVVVEGTVKWLWYPYFDNGKLINIKKRTIPPADRAFKRLFGGKSVMFNSDALACKEDNIIIVEGEADCVAIWSKGITNVVSIPDGAGSLPTSTIDRLDRFHRIYLCYDGDDAGQNGATKAAKRLGLERCYNVRLPTGVKDANDYLKVHSGEDFKGLIEHSGKFDVEDVKSIIGVVQDMIVKMYVEGSAEKGLPFPWKNLTHLLGDMMPGDLVVVGGKPGVGKTTFALNCIHFLARQGVPGLLFELEMRPERLIPRIIAMDSGIPSLEAGTMEVLSKALEAMKNVPFYFAYKWKKPNWQVVEDTVKLCMRRYDIKFMVFDNLHFLCRKEERTEEVSMMIQNFKMLAEECGIPIMVIARPKKMGKKVIDSEDLAWSSDIHGDADSIILLHRDRKADSSNKDIKSSEGTYEEHTQIIVDKARFNAGGTCYLEAHDDKAIFVE